MEPRARHILLYLSKVIGMQNN